MTVVVPKVTKIFDDMKATLPWTTRLLIFVSNLLAELVVRLILPLFGGAIFGFFRWKASPKGQPGLGPLRAQGAGVRQPGADARHRPLHAHAGHAAQERRPAARPRWTSSRTSSPTRCSPTVVENARDAIREGESIAAPLKRSGEFPPLVHHMIAIGERSGQLEEMLVNVADSYETQVSVRIGALTALLEPLIIVVMGGAVAFVAF